MFGSPSIRKLHIAIALATAPGGESTVLESRIGMRAVRERVVILFCAALAAALVGALASGCGSHKLAPARCATAQLRASTGGGGAALGTVTNTIALQNTGRACWLKGYPSLRVTGTRGLLPTQIVHGGGTVIPNKAPRLVELAHLGKAKVIISYVDVPRGKQASCPDGRAILLRPPGAKGWLTIPLRTGACDHILHESAVLTAGIRAPP